MIEGVVVEVVILAALICVLFVFCTVEFFVLRRTMLKVKEEAAKTGLILRVMAKKLTSFEKSLEVHNNNMAQIEQNPRFYNNSINDSIEHQYERARRVLKHGAKDDLSKLRQCDMTDEEIELLTDLVD